MFDVSHLLAWLLLTIAVPLIAPVALLPLLALSRRLRHRAGELLHRSIRKGQLCWTAIALSAAALYETAGTLTHDAMASAGRRTSREGRWWAATLGCSWLRLSSSCWALLIRQWPRTLATGLPAHRMPGEGIDVATLMSGLFAIFAHAWTVRH